MKEQMGERPVLIPLNLLLCAVDTNNTAYYFNAAWRWDQKETLDIQKFLFLQISLYDQRTFIHNH